MGLEAFRKLSYGLYIVSSMKDGRMNGQIANALFQVTSNPPTIAMSINKENLTYEYLRASGKFSVSILSENTPMTFIGLFGFKSGKNINKFEGVNYKLGTTGAPIVLQHAIAYIEAEVSGKIDCNTHMVLTARVLDSNVLNDQPALTYAYYRDTKGGKASKNAPTYVKEEPRPKAEKMPKYVCSICGYIYDPAKGDPEGGIRPGVRFEDLPDGWTCPVCGADKSKFEIES